MTPADGTAQNSYFEQARLPSESRRSGHPVPGKSGSGLGFLSNGGRWHDCWVWASLRMPMPYASGATRHEQVQQAEVLAEAADLSCTPGKRSRSATHSGPTSKPRTSWSRRRNSVPTR